MIWYLWRKGIRNVHSIKYCRSKYLTVPVFGQEPLLVAASVRTLLGHGGSVAAVVVLRVTCPRGSLEVADRTSSNTMAQAFDARMPRISAGGKAAPGWRWETKSDMKHSF